MFAMGYAKAKTEEKKDQSTGIRDLISGNTVEIHDPESYALETVLIDSAYYTFCGREFRFMLCHARQSGLKIA